MKKLKRFLTGGSSYGKLMMLIGLFIAIPLAVLPFYPQDREYFLAFLLPAAVSLALGATVNVIRRRRTGGMTEWQSSMEKGSLPVLFAWCYGFLAGALPFVLGGRLTFVQALFESVSGWSTTGLTVMDVAATPHIYLFHRSFMQYSGGLGFIMVMAMFFHSKQSMDLFNAEGHPDRLMPNLKKTAQTIFLLYNSFLVAGIFLYAAFGMGWFDAICHSMSALSTAGFTTQTQSIGAYNSIPIEVVTNILMVIGSTNFAVLLLLAQGRIGQLLRVSEVRFLGAVLAVFIPLTAISLAGATGMGFWESLHEASFGVITTYSTTGYSTMNYAQWPPFAVGLLILLMWIGGGIGSTAGGIKLVRVYLLLRIARENIRKRMSPARRITAPSYYRAQGKTPIDEGVVSDTVGFAMCYLGITVAGTLLLTLTSGCSLMDALFEFSSAFGTVGISNGLTGPHTNAATLIVEMVGMALGRLEIFIVFVGLYSGVHTAALKVRGFAAKRSFEKRAR